MSTTVNDPFYLDKITTHGLSCTCDTCAERLYKATHPNCPHGLPWDEFCECCMIERQKYMAWATATGREPY